MIGAAVTVRESKIIAERDADARAYGGGRAFARRRVGIAPGGSLRIWTGRFDYQDINMIIKI